MSAVSVGVAPSGEYLQSEGLVWQVGAVVCLVRCTAPPVVFAPLPRLYSAPQRGFLVEIALFQVIPFMLLSGDGTDDSVIEFILCSNDSFLQLSHIVDAVFVCLHH